MPNSKMKRANRIAKSISYGKRARKEHLRVVHPDGKIDCVCEQSIHFFMKAKSNGCGCRGRAFGNPKYGRGICVRSGDLRPAVAERVAGKRLTRAAMRDTFED